MEINRLRMLSVVLCHVGMCLSAFSTQAQMITLGDAVALAHKSNPQLLGAEANLDAAKARVRQAFSQMMPQLSASATANWYHRNYETQGLFGSDDISHYPGQGVQFNLSQPIWRRANSIAVSQARATAGQSRFELEAAEEDMLVALAQSWFDVMAAQDSVIAAKATVDTTQSELAQQEKAAQLQLSASPDLEQSRSKFEQAVAQLAAARGDLEEKFANLEDIVGSIDTFPVPALAASYATPNGDVSQLDGLLNNIDNTNPNVLAAQEVFRAADAEVRKQRAGSEPTLDLVGAYSRNKQGSGNFPGQSAYDIKQSSVGLQLSIPLFSSGLQHAKVDEAMALRRKAQQDTITAARTARSNGKIAWFRWHTNQIQLKAALQTVKSAELDMQTATQAATTGLKSETDRLESRQHYLEAWRDLQKIRYDSIVNFFRIKAVTGDLHDKDLIALDSFLHQRTQEAAQSETGGLSNGVE
ncbi:MAG TPA: TolC family protein [Steroidobacteraceae bacterium]|nr:TolC family protein [Steroidobacteraceae bacterium]